MSEKVYNVLFLCTGNSARSILAEVQLNELGRGKFKAFSAGSHPNGTVNPFAIELLQNNGFSTRGLRSKSWDEFAVEGAPVMDYVITVCDQAAGEQCPFWPGQPMSAHWGVPDPAAIEGTDDQKRRAFRDIAAIMRKRIELFTALPASSLDRMSLKSKMDEIGKAT
jgi:arsenate reductase